MNVVDAANRHELLARAARGEAAAARALLDETGPVVYGFVFARVAGNEAVAEDVVQATYLEAVKSADGYRGEASLSTWLCSIARRQLARHYEAERKRALAETGLRLVRDDMQAVAQEDAVARQDEILRALGKLTPIHRQVLVLKYLDMRSGAEIASAIGRTPVQVQSLLQRARDSLRKVMEANDD